MKAIKDLIKWFLFMDDDSLAKEGTEDDPLQNALNFCFYLGLFIFPYLLSIEWGNIKAYISTLF